MKPLPKWVGVIGMLSTVYGSLNAAGVFAMLPAKWAGGVAAVGGVLAWLSHSFTGTGGATAPAPFLTDKGA